MVSETAAIEAYQLNILFLAKFCDLGSHELGCLFIVAACLSELGTDFWCESGGCGQCVTGFIINDLCVDVVVRTENC
jgi:hypothetical protein